MSLFGPLCMLKWKGRLCPCLEDAQDASARRALEVLDGLQVTWLRDSSSGKGAAGLVSKLFSGGSSTTSAGGVPAKLVWLDGDNGPVLQVQPQEEQQQQDESSGLQKSAGYMKTIGLDEIQKTKVQQQTITLKTVIAGNSRELLRFVVVTTGTNAEEINEALQALIAWEERRIPPEDRAVDNVQNRAQKAAHFYHREVEMKQMRREREKRKAKYVKDAGGLKYTALAMANRAEMT